MRLVRLELDNYIGIYNGSGLTHLEIDFTKCMNRITVIRGANGSGKSSLFKTIHPFSDINYYLIPGKDARKRIVYQLDDNSILDITYTYPDAGKGDGSRKSTTCDVILNGVDLNTSRNVNSGKDIICDTMDIDTGFLTLGQLSSEDRGLVDKKPSERKKFINTKLAEMDVFNDIYKRICKKSSELKGTVNNLSLDINKIGDTNSIQSNVYLWEGQLEDLEESKLVIFKDMTELSVRMKDIFGEDVNPDEELARLQYKQMSIKSEIEANKDCMSCTEEELKDNEHYKDKCETYLKMLESDQLKIVEELEAINQKITDTKTRISALGDIDLLSQYKDRIDELKIIKANFEKTCEEHGFFRYSDVTADEYDHAIRAFKMINSSEQRIRLDYSSGELEDSVSLLEGKLELESEEELSSSIENLTISLASLKTDIDKQIFYKEQSRGIENIPKGCGYKDECPFVKKMVEANSLIISEDEFNNLSRIYDRTAEDLKSAKIRLQYIKTLNKCVNDIRTLFNLEVASKDILLKFCTRQPVNPDDNIDMIKHSVLGGSWFNLDYQYFNDIRNSFISYKSYQTDIDNLTNEYKSLSKNEELLVYLNNQLASLMKDKEGKDKDYQDNMSEIIDYRKEVSEFTSFIEEYKLKLAKKNSMSELQKEFDDINAKVSTFSESYEQYRELKSKFTDAKARLNIIETNQIPAIKNRIEESKYKLVLYNDYVEKYERYSKEYEKIEVIKYCCSPTTGIQTVYAEMYMNKILGISNQLLSMFFGGEFVMQPFVINDKEFRMPVLGSGVMNDDISSMSTSQKCIMAMIISFALLSNASSIYKIIKIDEIDSPLDTINRSAFFHALDTLMEYLKFDQCIMISHNVELNMSNTDIIVLRNDDPDLRLDGNIIYSLEE